MYSKWKNRILSELGKPGSSRDIEFENIPSIIKRCPKCQSVSLEYDSKKGRIYCTKCGFEEYILKIK
ncbi:MAG: TFIIB-type zinc ribbon-containing protein [Nanoarchaeota archaeon]|nr:TFIIB-type zinc ribbon-containing protein [Nanoarchaeota archaeon]